MQIWNTTDRTCAYEENYSVRAGNVATLLKKTQFYRHSVCQALCVALTNIICTVLGQNIPCKIGASATRSVTLRDVLTHNPFALGGRRVLRTIREINLTRGPDSNL